MSRLRMKYKLYDISFFHLWLLTLHTYTISLYLNLCSTMVDWTLRNKLQWNLNLNIQLCIKKKYLKILSAKWCSYCGGFNVLPNWGRVTHICVIKTYQHCFRLNDEYCELDHGNMSPGKRQPFCCGLNVLNTDTGNCTIAMLLPMGYSPMVFLSHLDFIPSAPIYTCFWIFIFMSFWWIHAKETQLQSVSNGVMSLLHEATDFISRPRLITDMNHIWQIWIFLLSKSFFVLL